MAGLFKNCDTYDGVPVYRDFEYLRSYTNPKDIEFKTLSPVWTDLGLLLPIAHSDTPVYMCVPREECAKMLKELFNTERGML